MPRYASRIKHYEGAEPLFHKYGIENEISRIQQRHVPLPHGGSIVIEVIFALHGRTVELTRTHMLYCLFRHMASGTVSDGERVRLPRDRGLALTRGDVLADVGCRD